MPRTHLTASALPLALLLGGAACAGARPSSAPAPLPAPVAAVPDSAPAPAAPEKVDEGFAIERTPNGTVGRELLGTATYDLPVEANQWVAMEVSFLTTQRHDVVGRWLERGERYGAFVRATFAAAGIPRDLHHLAMVESGYQPMARSRAGAVGMWQFMAGTGRGAGLRIDDQVDERMDPVRSTRAAARHLRELWNDFGHDWALAAAAYNAGGGRITRGLQSASATGFWDLAERGNLAEETRRYVPRLYAVTIIAKDPARFGYARPTGAAATFAFDSVRVDLATPLPVLAQAGRLSLADLSDLNPHLFRGVAPAFYWVWVPKGSGPATQQAYEASEFRRRGGFAGYTLRRGEDEAGIAEKSGLTLDQLRDLNPGVDLDRLGRGDHLRLYADAARALGDRPAERLASRDADPDDDRGRPDDRETGLVRPRRSRHAAAAADAPRSTRDGVAGDAVPSSRRAERSERVARRGDDDPPARARDVPGSRTHADEGARLAGSSGLSPVVRHTVEDGETLASLARRYGVSVARIRRANELDADARIRPGQRLRIPRAQAADAGGDGTRAERRHGAERGVPAHRRTVQHQVRRGETLFGIARTYDTTVAAIREANDLDADAVLQPGQTLRIPRPADADGR